MRLGQAPHGLAVDEVFARLHRVGVAVDAVLQRGGVHRAGANAIAANALAHIVGGHAFGQANHRSFGGAVNEAAGQALDAGTHAGHVDDAARLAVLFEALQHAGHHGLDHPKLRPHIELKGEVPIGVGGFEHRAVVHKARAVEQDVNRRQGRHLARDGGFVEHIQGGGVHAGHALVALQQGGVDVGGPHRGTLAGHGQCSGFADALTGSGDEGGFSLEALAHGG